MERLTFKVSNGDNSKKYNAAEDSLIDNCKSEKYGVQIGEHIDRLAEYEDLEEKGLLVKLPFKVGDTYTGICQEVVPSKKGWKTKRWLDNGTIEEIEIIVHLTAEKAGYNHSRSVKELGEYWFVGDKAKESAAKALEGMKE